MLTFDELHRSLLLRPEYGMLKHRKSIEREIWNCALDAAKNSVSEAFHDAIDELKA